MVRFFPLALLVFLPSFLNAQEAVRPKDVREAAKAGSAAMPRLQEFLKNPDIEVRLEAVKQIVAIGTQRSLDPLVLAAADNDPEIQIRATDGLVNFYLPGYLKTGFSASLQRASNTVKGRFTDTNDDVIDPFITVRPDVIEAIGKLARGGVGMEVRANAARAIGILRGRAAIPDLLVALRTKDSRVMYESLIAIQKINDQSVGPQVGFLLRDLDAKVQLAAIETAGLLQNREALPVLRDVLNRTSDAKVRRAALTSIAMMPAEENRSLYAQYLTDRDDKLRAAAAEGFARLKKPQDVPTIQKAWADEGKPGTRLSLAFAMVMLGQKEISEFSPLQYLINQLNSAAYKGIAFPFLVELARDAGVRHALVAALPGGTRDEKIGIAGILARSGDKDSLAELQKWTNADDPEVAREVLRAVRTLQARL